VINSSVLQMSTVFSENFIVILESIYDILNAILYTYSARMLSGDEIVAPGIVSLTIWCHQCFALKFFLMFVWS
jgi:hypothetical protein